MDIRNGVITGKRRRHCKPGTFPSDLGTQQTHRPVARWLFPLARLLLHKVFSRSYVLIHYVSCSTRPSCQTRERVSTFLPFTLSAGTREFWSQRGTPPPRPRIGEHWRQCLKIAFVWSSIRDKMKKLSDGVGPALPRHDKPVNTLTLGRNYPPRWKADVPTLSRQLHAPKS